jgi:hypothetical protein
LAAGLTHIPFVLSLCPSPPATCPTADMRAVATRNGSRQDALSPVPSPSAGGSSSGGGTAGMSQEALRRLRETQALLIRFSEENQRLARENDKLRGSKNVLGQEHANVLDEIDMLRGKLLQLEQSVRTAAVGGSHGGAAGAEGGALAGAAAAAAVAAAGAKGGGSSSQSLVTDTGRIDVKALLASLGLGEAATADLPGVGVGAPSGAWYTEGAEEAGEGSSSSLNSSFRSSASRAGPLAAADASGSRQASTAAAAAAGGGGSGSPGNSARGLPVPPGSNADAAAAAAGVSGRNTPVRQPSPLRPLMSPVRTGSSSSTAATQLLGSTAGPRPGLLATGNVAAAAKSVIGRNAPLSATRVQPWADPPSDHKDSITVTDAAKLAALFNAQAGMAAAAGGEGGSAAAAGAGGKGGHHVDHPGLQQQQPSRPGSLGALQRQPSLGAQKAVSFRPHGQ